MANPNDTPCHRRGSWRRAVRLAALLGLLVLAWLPGGAWAAAQLQSLEFTALPGNRLELAIQTDSAVEDFKSFSTDNPPRLVIDLPDTRSALGYKTQSVAVGVARSLAAIEAGGRTRVVLNLLDAVPYQIRGEGNRILVTLQETSTQSTTAAREIALAGVDTARDSGTRGGPAVANIDFQRGTDGQGRVEILLSEPEVAVNMRQLGDRIVLDIEGVELPRELARTLDVVDFATPVTEILARPEGDNTQITIVASGDYEHLGYQTGSLYVVEVRPLSRAEKERLARERKIYEGERLSLNFQDIEVRSVLQLLADFTGLNMVVSDSVTGSVTLRLKNVPWDQAMDIILKTKGLSMRRSDNVVLVAPTEEIAARERLELESQQQIEELVPLRSEIIQVNYAKAQDLRDLLSSEANNFMSDRGSITLDTRTNTLLVQDTAAKLDEVRELIRNLDVPVRQVLIESRIVIATDDFSRALGAKFGLSGASNSGIGGNTAGGSLGYPDSPVLTPGASAEGDFTVTLPAEALAGSALNLLIGKADSHLLTLELDALQQEGKGETVSNPRVITADQSQASIRQGLEIPYTVRDDDGNESVEFNEALLSLDVTPQITPDDRIIMELKVNKDNPDFASRVEGEPVPINRREVVTKVLVNNGETVVLGGVFEGDKSTGITKVPLLGDLPVVGALFRSKEVRDVNNELMIFVTPKILKDSLSLR